MRPLFASTVLLSLAFAVAGCGDDPSDEVNDVEPIGTVSGAFTCQITDDGASNFDLGQAWFEGDIEHTGFIAALRTQGCYARNVEADRGWVVSIRMFQQIDFDTAQVLELNLPIGVDVEGGEDRLLQNGDLVTMSGNEGFGSMFWVDGAGGAADPLFLRTAGGEVWIDEPDGLGPGDWFSGHFDSLRMGEL